MSGKLKIGVFLEAGYKKDGGTLCCEDVYALLFNMLQQDGEYAFSFLGRQIEYKSGNMYEIESYDKFFELTPYRNLPALCAQWGRFKKKNQAIMDEFVRSVDKLLVMSPMPICIELIKLGIKYHKPIVLLARQDTRRVLPQRYYGGKKMVATILAHTFEREVEQLLKYPHIRVLALGNAIAQRFRRFTDRVYTISTSPYRLTDVLSREELRPIDWSKKVRLLFVGRVEVNKGLHELLASLSERYPFEWSLTLVGDGAFMPEVNRLLWQYHIADRVQLTGYIPFGEELIGLYKSHDILILPSYSEGLPHVVLESMACGCLTLATRVGGIPDVVKHGQTGLLFSPKNVGDLTQTLIYAHAHRADMEQIKVNALEVARKYSFDNQIGILKAQLSC